MVLGTGIPKKKVGTSDVQNISCFHGTWKFISM